MFPKRLMWSAVLVGVAIAPGACGEEGPDGLFGPDATAVLSPATATLTAIGDTLLMDIVVTNASRDVLNTELNWTSLDPGVATVDAQGRVIATGPGTARIVASIETLADTSLITVAPAPASLELRLVGGTSAVTAPIAVNALRDTVRLRAIVRDRRGNEISGQTVTWTSLDPTIVSVAGGTAVALANGTGRVTGAAGSLSATATLQVAQTPSALVISPRNQMLDAFGATVQLTGSVRDRNGNVMSGPTAAITWLSQAPGVATVSGTGLVSAVANGSALILGQVGATVADVATVQVAQAIARVALSPSNVNLIVGQSIDLVGTAFDSRDNPNMDAPLDWFSSNSDVARVSSSGHLEAVSSGSAVITLTSGGRTATANVSVQAPFEPVSIVSIIPAEALTTPGGTVQLLTSVRGSFGSTLTDRNVVWASSDPSIASIDADGRVTGNLEGGVLITAYADGVPGYASVVVRRQVGVINITPAATSVVIGNSTQLFSAVLDEAGNPVGGRSVVWSSSDPTIATVDATGRVNGVALGTVTITASSEGVSGTSTVTVTDIAVATVSVAPPVSNIFVGGTAALTATTYSIGGAVLVGRPVAWSSSNEAVATVDASGVVTGVGAGSATITATAEGIDGTATVNVTPVGPPPPAPVASVTVAPVASNIGVAGTVALTATTRDALGVELVGRVVTWSSDNAAIATVDGAGVVTGVADGMATITATSEGINGSATVTVTAVAPPPPLPLTAGVAAAGPSGSTSVNLVASAATGGTAPYTYQWYRGTVSGFATDAGSAIAGATALTFNDTGLTEGTTYFYKVVATDAVAATVTYAEVNATPGDFNAQAGPNEPAGFKRIFVLDGTTTNPEISNAGFMAFGQKTIGQWDVNGGPVSSAMGGNRVESVDVAGALDGKAIRHWLFPGDGPTWHGFIHSQMQNFMPPGWATTVGIQRSYYLRVRMKFSPNFQENPGRYKPWGYLGSARGLTVPGEGAPNDYYMSLQMDNPAPGNKIQMALQNAGVGSVSLFRSTTSPGITTRDTWYDMELIITTESSEGALDGRVQMWINGDLFMDRPNLAIDPGMNGFEMPMFWGGGAATVTENIFTDYDIYYLSAGN